MRNNNSELQISDNFYEIYSFSHDFGYNSDMEIKSIKEMLINHNLSTDNVNVCDTLNIIKEITTTLDKDYKKECKQYSDWREKQHIVRGDQPFLISLAKDIFIALIVLGVSFYVKNNLGEENTDKAIIQDIVKKMNDNKSHQKIIVKIQKKYELIKDEE